MPDFTGHREKIARGRFTAEELTQLVLELQRDRFDEFIPNVLLQEAFEVEVLDLENAQRTAATQ